MANKGEGSKGGHIIGHTKSGTPIYGDHRDTAAKVDAGKKHTEAKTSHAASKPSDHWSTGADMVTGFLLAGPIGAAVGYAYGNSVNHADGADKKASSASPEPKVNGVSKEQDDKDFQDAIRKGPPGGWPKYDNGMDQVTDKGLSPKDTQKKGESDEDWSDRLGDKRRTDDGTGPAKWRT